MPDPRVDLVIRRVGSQFCLFTSDGSRRLGCHPTREQAVAQEGAIKARQAQASKLHAELWPHGGRDPGEIVQLAADLAEGPEGESEIDFLARHFQLTGGEGFVSRFGCAGVSKIWSGVGGHFHTCMTSGAAAKAGDPASFCGDLKAAARTCGLAVHEGGGAASRDAEIQVVALADDPAQDPHVIEVRADGSVLKEQPVASIGDKFVNGPREFSMSEKDVDQAIKNFEARGFPIPVTQGHHDPHERQKQPARAWIEKLFPRDGKLWSWTRYLKDTWGEIRDGKWKGISLEFFANDKDQLGQPIGMNIDGAALTNYPFFHFRIDNAADRAAERGGRFVALARFGGQEDRVDTDKDKVKGGEKIELSKAEHEKLVKENADLREKLKGLEQGGGDSAQQLAKANERIQTLEGIRQDDQIRHLLLDLKGRGVNLPLGDVELEKDGEPRKFLSEKLGWTVDGLRRAVKDDSMFSKIKLGGELSGGLPGSGPAPDAKSLEGRKAMILARVRQLEAQYKDDFDAMVERRSLTKYEYARMDLEADFRARGTPLAFPKEGDGGGDGKKTA